MAASAELTTSLGLTVTRGSLLPAPPKVHRSGWVKVLKLMHELGRRRRDAMLYKIGRARAGDQADRADARCAERRVRERADTHADIEALFNQIDDAIDQKHARGNARESVQERSDDRQHMQPAEHDGRGEGKLAARLGLLARHAAPGVVELIEHLAAGGGVGPPGLRQREPPRRSRDQARVELVFERLQLAADR